MQMKMILKNAGFSCWICGILIYLKMFVCVDNELKEENNLFVEQMKKIITFKNTDLSSLKIWNILI